MGFRRVFTLFFLLFTITLTPLTIKIGSIAPLRSPWGKALKRLSSEWSKISKGRIKLKIYAGGIVGTEEDMIRKMRVGLLGGAAFSNIGLTILYPDIYVLNIPFLIQTDEELDYVMTRMIPRFEQEIEKKGYRVIVWSTVGWLHFFGKKKVGTPQDLSKLKISFQGSPMEEQAWKDMGFHVIQTEVKDLLMSLQTGMVTAFYLPPLLAGTGQYFAIAPYMLDFKIAPLFGGIVLKEETWNKIPKILHAPLQKSARKITTDLYKEVSSIERNAIEKMQTHGLILHTSTEEVKKIWRETSAKGMGALIGKAFSKEIYDLLISIITEYRQKTKSVHTPPPPAVDSGGAKSY